MAETLDFHLDEVVGTVKRTLGISSLVAIVVVHDISISSERGWLSTFLPTELPLVHIWRLRYDASLVETFDRFLGLGDRLLEALNRISGAYEEVSHLMIDTGSKVPEKSSINLWSTPGSAVYRPCWSRPGWSFAETSTSFRRRQCTELEAESYGQGCSSP